MAIEAGLGYQDADFLVGLRVTHNSSSQCYNPSFNHRSRNRAICQQLYDLRLEVERDDVAARTPP
jgi:hypothetical protein